MKIKLITWLPAILIMILIFSFSAKPAVESSESSIGIANEILTIYENITDHNLEDSLRVDRLLLIEHMIRKGAHFTEYAVLAAALAFPLWLRKYRSFKIMLTSITLAGLYAATDEFHQLFVPGRSGEVKDVLIDTSGAVFGAIVFFCITKILVRKKNQRKQKA